MSKLSELIPAGGSAKELSAVASGTLPNGRAVILKTNGQVELVALIPVTESIPSGSASVFHTSSVEYATVAYDPNTANKFITVYKNSTTTYGTAVVGTVSGNSISFGTPTVFNTAATNYIEIAFDPYTADKFAIVYSNAGNSGAGTAIVGAVSGTSLTFGNPQVFNTGFTGLFGFAFDSNTVNRLLVTYYDSGNSNYGTALSGLIFATNLISWGSEVVFNSATTINTEVQFDPNTAQKFVVSYKDNGNNAYGTTKVGTLSGSAISFNGAAHVFNPASTGEFISLSFDPNTANKFVVAYLDTANSSYGTARVGTVSGTSISYGSEYVFNAGSTSYISVRFNPNTANQFVISYDDNANSQHGTAIVGTVSGTAISFGSEYVFNSAATIYTRISFDPNTIGKFVINYYNGGNTDGEAILGQLAAPSLTNLTSTNFVGFASEAISSGATGVINPVGGVAASVSNTPLLQSYGSEVAATSANSYYVNTSYDPNNANRFVVVWAAPSGGGKAVVGTVSGTSITYGSIASFSSSNTGAVSNVAFDSNTANKLVITFQDDGNSGYGTAVVGTLSGTSLSFGSKYVFDSANINDPAVGFNPNTANQLVVAYGGGSSGYSRVGTVSGTSISFATRVTFNSLTQYISISFDINTANKFIICYRDRGNANYGKVIVGAISGTSLSYGTEVTFYPNNISQMVAAYDPSQANKVVIIYRNDFASDVGVALVGTVNGTTISYGTAVVFNNASTSSLNLAFQKTGSKFIITYADNGNSSYGTSITGTLSGTNVTFGAENVFNSGSVEYTSISFDENTLGKFVVAYKDTSNSNYPTAISGNLSDNLTIGSTYYVQSDGTVSTVSTSPAVNAGKAISATSLLLKG